jgi:16S rRNA (uracil1498-N3)-methyltransferase
MTYTPRIRLFVDDPLAANADARASDAHAHYLLNVMRAKAGDQVCLFNGHDGEWQATISVPGKKQVAFAVGAQLRPQTPEPDVWLAFAPVKRIDFLSEKATELGASALQPVLTRRTGISRVNTTRMLANAVEAAEQSDRLSVPTIHPPVKLDELLATWPASRTLYFLDETGGGTPIAEVFRNNQAPSVGFLTGPEGGFEQSELDALRQVPFANAVGLGPRVLRAETAALAALACWQALAGDWKHKRA